MALQRGGEIRWCEDGRFSTGETCNTTYIRNLPPRYCSSNLSSDRQWEIMIVERRYQVATRGSRGGGGGEVRPSAVIKPVAQISTHICISLSFSWNCTSLFVVQEVKEGSDFDQEWRVSINKHCPCFMVLPAKDKNQVASSSYQAKSQSTEKIK